MPSAFSCNRQAGHGSLRVDPPELVALERVAATVERPAVTRAHELVVDHEALGEVVIEVRARSRRAAELAARRATRRTRDRRLRLRRPRPAQRAGRVALRPARPRPHVKRGASRPRAEPCEAAACRRRSVAASAATCRSRRRAARSTPVVASAPRSVVQATATCSATWSCHGRATTWTAIGSRRRHGQHDDRRAGKARRQREDVVGLGHRPVLGRDRGDRGHDHHVDRPGTRTASACGSGPSRGAGSRSRRCPTGPRRVSSTAG